MSKLCSHCGTGMMGHSHVCIACGRISAPLHPHASELPSRPSVSLTSLPGSDHGMRGLRRPANGIEEHEGSRYLRLSDKAEDWRKHVEAEVNRAWAAVITCHFVQNNPMYQECAGHVALGMMEDDNASAGIHKKTKVPCILFGYPLAERNFLLAGYFGQAVAERRGVSWLTNAVKQVFRRRANQLPRHFCPITRAVDDAVRSAEALSIAREVAFGNQAAVLAHELGHLALGHCAKPTREHEVRRNQEREADSFASSVSHSLIPRHAATAGSLLYFMSPRDLGADGPVTTHPRDRERFENILRAQDAGVTEVAQRYGITRDDWIAMLDDNI